MLHTTNHLQSVDRNPLPGSKQTVFIVDDDYAVRDSMALLMVSVGLEYESFASADEFLKECQADRCGCLVLDIRMPGISGLELQKTLSARGSTLPILFITGHGDVPMAVEAIKNGAVDFIQKPFRDQVLLDAISLALKTDRSRQAATERSSAANTRRATLTPREGEVFDLIVTGKLNKVIAHELGVSVRTIEIHRSRVMDKMQAKSLADLVRMALPQ